jgi:hypothetical protein
VKASPVRLARAHYRTYVNAGTGKRLWRDDVVFEGLPAGLFLGCLLSGVKIPAAASVGVLTVAGLLSAFLFAVMLQMSQRAMDWADQPPERGQKVHELAVFMEETSANAGYASLVSILTAVAFVVASVVSREVLVVFTALGLALALHMALMMLLVLSNVFALTQNRLTAARTKGPAPVTTLGKHRNAS